MKPVKSLVSSRGECQQANPLTSFSGQMVGAVEKAQLMNKMAARVSETQPAVPSLASVHPILGFGEDWVSEFGPMSAAPLGSYSRMAAPAVYSAHTYGSSSSVMPFGPMRPFMQPPMMSSAPSQVYTPSQSESVQSTASLSVNDDLSAAKRMVELLRNSGNPKFANSTFVDFIDQVANRQLRFTPEGQVVDGSGAEVSWEDVMKEDKYGSDLYGDVGDDAENFPVQMEQIWNELNSAGLSPDSSQYVFQHTHNPYLDSTDNLLELAKSLMDALRDKEALMVLEAEVRVNPNSSEGWRMLGQLHAQFDNDSEAIKCLSKGYLCDSLNLDSLLAYGVSLTNEMDSVRAMTVLKEWIVANEKYFDLVSEGRSNSDPSSLYPSYDFTRLRKEVVGLFSQAWGRDSGDPAVATALGVLHNISRDFSAAIYYLIQAVVLDPSDFSAWNKLGATLANAGLSQEALSVYHEALSLKPNYARAWSNLGIAHANMEDYGNAARFFLAAITMGSSQSHVGSSQSHVWTSLFMALSNLDPNNTAFGELYDKKDVEGLTRLIGNVPETLPQPRLSDPAQVSNLVNKLKTTLGID